VEDARAPFSWASRRPYQISDAAPPISSSWLDGRTLALAARVRRPKLLDCGIGIGPCGCVGLSAAVSARTNVKIDGFMKAWARRAAASAAEPASVEKGLFLGSTCATERAVPVREAPEPADDVRVDFSMPQTMGIGAAAKEGDTAFLIGEVL
jgi:hypothetical protein